MNECIRDIGAVPSLSPCICVSSSLPWVSYKQQTRGASKRKFKPPTTALRWMGEIATSCLLFRGCVVFWAIIRGGNTETKVKNLSRKDKGDRVVIFPISCCVRISAAADDPLSRFSFLSLKETLHVPIHPPLSLFLSEQYTRLLNRKERDPLLTRAPGCQQSNKPSVKLCGRLTQ